MTVTRPLAITPLTDITTWLRGRGLEIVLLVPGAVLLARFVTWCGRRITERMDATATDEDALVRSEAAKHRGAHPPTPGRSRLQPGRLGGRDRGRLGFGAQQVVRDLLAGLFIVMERQYGYGDLVHISAVGFEGTTGTIEDVALRTTRLRTLTGDVVTSPTA